MILKTEYDRPKLEESEKYDYTKKIIHPLIVKKHRYILLYGAIHNESNTGFIIIDGSRDRTDADYIDNSNMKQLDMKNFVYEITICS